MALLNNSSGLSSSTFNNSPASIGLSSQKMSAALKKVKGNIERLFEKSLADMIRGIRNNKEHEAKYIAQCIEEIKQELKQDNIVLKANAIAKLSYLQMLGYDVSWAAFNIIEVMTSTRFTFKRVGYLSASQCFNDNTEVIMLTTNLIRKDLNSSNMYESGVSLGALSCFVTPDLARDLANDVVALLTSSKPYIRKRAVLLLYKIFLRYPDALRPTFSRLKEKLEDPDQGVQSAAVNVICELARKNPKNYLSLAPMFFKLMTSSTNNWMLIKIIKLFGALTPFEPRLGKKLIEPLTNLINSTSAMSLLYECINTVIAVLISISSEAPGNHTASIQLCVQKLSALIEDTDQNLKYLGLLAMGKILQTHPKAVQVHKDLILACLDDKDESIRLRALGLLYGMVSKKNIMEIVKKLLQHVEKAEGSVYRDELLSKIVQICSHNNYQHITNFEWYVSVLVELTKVEGTKHGSLIADQMLDVAVRVPSIRHFAVSQTGLLIENAHLLLSGNYMHRNNMCEVLHAAAWICGEYSEHIRNPQIVLESLLRTRLAMVPGHIQSSFVQNIAKIYIRILQDAEKEDDWDKIYSVDNLMLSKLPVFEQTDCLEAQERACSVMQLVQEIDKFHKQNEKVAEDAVVLFEGDLGPVAPKAQRKVPVPADLDLLSWINEPLPETSSESEPEVHQPGSVERHHKRPGSLTVFNDEAGGKSDQNRPQKRPPSEEDMKKMREARLAEMEHNPNYLKINSSTSSKNLTKAASGSNLQKTSFDGKIQEITTIDLHSPLDIPGMVGLHKYMEQQEQTISWQTAKKEKKSSRKEKKSTKSKKRQQTRDFNASSDDNDLGDGAALSSASTTQHDDVNRAAGAMPDGAKSTDEEDPSPDTEKFKALDINLDEPLKPEERLPVLHHRVTPPIPKSDSNGMVRNTHAMSPVPLDLDAKVKKSKKSSKKHSEKLEKKEKVSKDKSDDKKKKASKKDREGGKKASDSSGKKVRRSKSPSSGGVALLLHDRNDYEEASGLCTPTQQTTTAGVRAGSLSQSNASSARHSPVMTSQSASVTVAPVPAYGNCRILAKNQHMQLTYDAKTSLSEPDTLSVDVVFTNLCDIEINKLELNILDSLNLKLIKDDKTDEVIRLSFALPGRATSNKELRFFICQTINAPQKLRGNLTYMLKTEHGSVSEKLDFRLLFRCINFTVPATTSNDSFTDLLSRGELSAKHTINFECPLTFGDILAKLYTISTLSVVETDLPNSTASLFSQTIHSHPICLLIKQQGSLVRIDGKSTDVTLITHFLDEIREFLV